MERILKIIDNINEWIGRVFCWTVSVLTVVVVLEVILRRYFNSPTIWSFDIIKQLFGCYFMILAGYTLLHGSHVSIDIVETKFSKKTRAIMATTCYFIFFFPFGIVLLWQGIRYAALSWSIHETTMTAFSFPLYPFKTVIPITGFLLLIQGLVIVIRNIQTLREVEKK